MVKFMIIFLIGFSASKLYSQEADFILSKFFAVQVDDQVLLRWTIEKGNTCEDTYVERSQDGIYFERIGLIGGICGSPDASITYDFYDSLPLLNRDNYYRLMLGQYGFTSIKSVEFINYSDKGFILGPNPFTDFTTFRFENEKNEEFTIIISDIMGRKLYQSSTTSNEIVIRKNDLGSGLFLYRLLKTGNVISEGKLLSL
jgi:hypothetical protein